MLASASEWIYTNSEIQVVGPTYFNNYFTKKTTICYSPHMLSKTTTEDPSLGTNHNFLFSGSSFSCLFICSMGATFRFRPWNNKISANFIFIIFYYYLLLILNSNITTQHNNLSPLRYLLIPSSSFFISFFCFFFVQL